MPTGAIVALFTLGAWKSELAWAPPLPFPGTVHDATAGVAAATRATATAARSRGRATPLRRAGSTRYLVARGGRGQVERERGALAGVSGRTAHRDGAGGVDVERVVGGDVPAGAAVRLRGERERAQIAGAVAGIDGEAVRALAAVERDRRHVHRERVVVGDRRGDVGRAVRVEGGPGRAGREHEARGRGGGGGAGAAADHRPGAVRSDAGDQEPGQRDSRKARDLDTRHGRILFAGEKEQTPT